MVWHRRDGDDNLILTLHVQTGGKCTEAVGLHGDALKVKLAASPVEGKANAALLKFLAMCFNVRLSRVTLKQGAKSRHKVIEIRQSACGPDVLFKSLNGN